MFLKCVVLLLLSIIVCGCGSTIQSDVKPGFDDLSGIYRFIDLNGFSAAEFPNPLIDFNEIAEPSDVTIVQSTTTIQTTYLTDQGEAITNEFSLTGENNTTSV